MFKKLLLTTVFLFMLLPAQSVLAESDSEKSVKKAFKEYQKALKKEDYKKAWNSYSMSFQSKNNYENLRNKFDKEMRDVFSSLKIEEINSTDSNVILKTKLGGWWSIFTKRKFYFKFILEEQKWKINEMYQSIFSRPPRRGYRPEDFSGLDENTKAEISAIQQLCLKYTKSLSVKDFRSAWECYWEGRASYEKFLTFKWVKKIKNNESYRESWASLTVLDIKFSGNKATADLGRKKEGEIPDIFLLVKTENQWKIRKDFDTTSLRFDEKNLPSFYFEDDKNYGGIQKKE